MARMITVQNWNGTSSNHYRDGTIVTPVDHRWLHTNTQWSKIKILKQQAMYTSELLETADRNHFLRGRQLATLLFSKTVARPGATFIQRI